VAPEVAGTEGQEGRPDIELVEETGRYRVLLGERWFGPYKDPDTALRGLSSGIHYILGQRSPMTFLHAGAVEIGGRAFVFPGGGRYGKSVLVARLVEEGCGYLCDEWAVFSPGGSVFPLSKPIRLRGPDGDFYARPPGVSLPGGFPCAGLVLTRFAPDARWDPRFITPGQAIMRLLSSTLRCGVAPDETLESLTRVTSRAVCVSSRRGDGEPSVKQLLNLLESKDSIDTACDEVFASVR
jgi:hypothetical protein